MMTSNIIMIIEIVIINFIKYTSFRFVKASNILWKVVEVSSSIVQPTHWDWYMNCDVELWSS